MVALEDFFTLGEIEDGFASPSRVEELINVIKFDKDCIGKNIDDTATRQWIAVAKTISVTKSKDCLDRFMQLDGLRFIDGWLRDAQKCGKDSSEINVEESIVALLKALENLHIDNPGSFFPGIEVTVKNLFAHCSSPVQNIARTLVDSWKQDNRIDAECLQASDKEETHLTEVCEADSGVQIQKSDVEEHIAIDGVEESVSLNEKNKASENVSNQPENCKDQKSAVHKRCSSSDQSVNLVAVRCSDSGGQDMEVEPLLEKSTVAVKNHEVLDNKEAPGTSNSTDKKDEVKSSLASEAAQEPENNTDKKPCDFDLNQEICNGDVDPIPVAVTSFQASEILECRLSEQKQELLDFDLNVAEDEEDTIAVRPAEPSLEIGFKRFERPRLDLNLSGDDDIESQLERQTFRNHFSHLNPSPASQRNIDLNDRPMFHNESNLGPTYNERTSQRTNLYQDFRPQEQDFSIMGTKVDVNRNEFIPPAPYLLPRANGIEHAYSSGYGYNGSTMVPNIPFPLPMCNPGSNLVSHQTPGSTQSFFPQSSFLMSLNSGTSRVNGSGRVWPNFDLSMNGAPPGFSGSRPVRPNIDLKSAPPHLKGSGTSRPSFDTSMNSAPLGFNMSEPGRRCLDLGMFGAPFPARPSFEQSRNGSGPVRSDFDLNNTGVSLEGGNRDNNNIVVRQMLMPNQGQPLEEHSRTNLQPSSSSGIKRKEPDSKWEPYPFGLRHRSQPP